MRRADIIVGLGFGDEGKGSVTDHFCREYGATLVVRFNGGHQAAHNVVTPDGFHHTFQSFGAGTLAGARTHLSKYTLISPMAIVREANDLSQKMSQDVMKLHSVSPYCVVVTEYHRLANLAAEQRTRNGSVGVGIGMARADELSGLAVYAFELQVDPRVLLQKLEQIEQKRRLEFPEVEDWPHPFDVAVALRRAGQHLTLVHDGDALDKHERVVFEGAQGVLLDENFGVCPYNTWTDCTFQNAEKLLAGTDFILNRVGVIRTYHTRHGNGPFPSEDETMVHPETHNVEHPWMGRFRQGVFDMTLFDYAVRCSHPNSIAMTHCDRLDRGVWRFVKHKRPWDAEGMEMHEMTVGQMLEHFSSRGFWQMWTSQGPTSDDKRRVEL